MSEVHGRYVLTLSCPDVTGVVHAVSGFLAGIGCNIVDSAQFGDSTTERFFMRVSFDVVDGVQDLNSLTGGFRPVAKRFGMTWELQGSTTRPRYMRVLSEVVCARIHGRVINIHHSFLPCFKGARPYQQAHARGVKPTGATAHYVTEELDEGPIIEQEVSRVDHAMTPRDLTGVGRDLESVALARAVQYHIERRVLLNGNRTVVFR